VVSKKGNLPLSVPVRGIGSIDDQERAIVESIVA
jgi:alpha-L-fucosidase